MTANNTSSEPLSVEGQVEVRNDSKGTLDEFIAERANVHLERMSDGHWWMGITTPDGSLWHLNFHTKRGTHIACFAERQHGPEA